LANPGTIADGDRLNAELSYEATHGKRMTTSEPQRGK
jgi:hypothetical protein